MFKFFISIISCLLFLGYATKEPIAKELPYYNKDKVNLYLLNNETELTNQKEYIYTIESKNFIKKINVCYSQYSYSQLEEGYYNIKAVQRDKISPFNDRQDHEYFNSFLEKGKSYILKIDTNYDSVSIGKFIASTVLDNSLDPKIKIVKIEKLEALEILEEMKNHTNLFGNRPYSLRAEDNEMDKTCLEIALKNIF